MKTKTGPNVMTRDKSLDDYPSPLLQITAVDFSKARLDLFTYFDYNSAHTDATGYSTAVFKINVNVCDDLQLC